MLKFPGLKKVTFNGLRLQKSVNSSLNRRPVCTGIAFLSPRGSIPIPLLEFQKVFNMSKAESLALRLPVYTNREECKLVRTSKL